MESGNDGAAFCVLIASSFWSEANYVMVNIKCSFMCDEIANSESGHERHDSWGIRTLSQSDTVLVHRCRL